MGWAAIPIGQYALMAFGWASFLAYTLIVIVLIVDRKTFLHLSFFALLLAQAIPDIVLILSIELYSRFKKYGIYETREEESRSSEVARLLFWFQNFTKVQLLLSYIPFAMNRLVMLYRPIFYYKLWTAKVTFGCVFIVWLISTAVITPFVCAKGSVFFFIRSSQTGEVNLSGSVDIVMLSIGIQITTWSTVIICLPAYLIAIKLTKQHLATSAKTKRREMACLLAAVLNFSVVSLEVFRSVCLLLAGMLYSSALNGIASTMWYYTTEILACVQPWALLATNALLRRRIARMARGLVHRLPFTSSQAHPSFRSALSDTTT